MPHFFFFFCASTRINNRLSLLVSALIGVPCRSLLRTNRTKASLLGPLPATHFLSAAQQYLYYRARVYTFAASLPCAHPISVHRRFDHLQQLDVQLGAGRVELTDLNINVSALAELLPPGLSFRVERAHVGRFRVEISYSNLLTESLAIFLDDVRVEITPSVSKPNEENLLGERMDATAREPVVSGPQGADVTDKVHGAGGRGAAAAAAGKKANNSPVAAKDQIGQAGERLDFLAQWIEQITSKVKVVVNSLTVRAAPAAAHLESAGFGERSSGDDNSIPCLEFRCSSLRWCDETPEVSSFMADQGPSAGIDRVEGPGTNNGGTAVFAHKVRYVDCCS